MDEDNFDDVLINIELEGWFFYVDSSNRNDYFIAYQIIVIASDSDNEDCEGELYCQLKSALSDENLIFTTVVGANDETHRIVGLPQIDSFEFENGSFTLLEDTNIVEAIEFFKNMKTIDFSDLTSNNLYDKKNFKRVKYNEMNEINSTKTEIKKNIPR